MSASSEATRPRFAVGDVVRRIGTPGEWRVTTVRENHGGAGQHRYWGEYLHRFGGSVGAYESELELVPVSSEATRPGSWCYIDDCRKRATLIIESYPDDITLCEDHAYLHREDEGWEP